MPSLRPALVLVISAMLVGAFAAPASAGTVTTECTLQAKNNPSTVGESASFRFFAAARSPEDTPPSPFGLVTFFDGLPIEGHVLGTALLGPDPEDLLKDNSNVTFSTSSLSVGDH